MYKIIGVDGKEYGPVTAEQLRQWIAEGRANEQTKIQVKGNTEWKTIAEFPEFAGSSDAAAATPPRSPVAPGFSPGSTIDIGSCISRGWNLVKNNFWPLVGTSLLIFFLIGGVGNMLRAAVNLSLGLPFRPPGLHGFDVIRFQWPGMLVSLLWNFFMGGALIGGLYNYYLKRIRGQMTSLADAFSGFSNAFIPLTMAYITTAILSLLGLLLCIIPGIYLGVSWRFTLPLVIDRQLGFWDAMETSRQAVTRQWFIIFALFLVAGVISALGLLLCCIGIFATAPIGIAAILYAYEDMFGGQSSQPTATAQTV
jgi:uncharacterized membrane protein